MGHKIILFSVKLDYNGASYVVTMTTSSVTMTTSSVTVVTNGVTMVTNVMV